MDPHDVLHILEPIFRDVLDLPSLRLRGEDSALTIPGWDSLAHINLVAAIEKEFGIRFALGELQDLKDVAAMVTLIVDKRGATVASRARQPGSAPARNTLRP